MRSKLFLLAIAAFFVSAIKAQQPRPIPGQFIVVLKESAAEPVKKKEKKNSNREQKAKDNKEAREKNLKKLKEVREKKNIKEASVLNEYADVIVGFSCKLTDNEKKALETDEDVAAVVQDYYVDLPPVTLEPNPPDVGFFYHYNRPKEETILPGNSGPFTYAAIDNTAYNDKPYNFIQLTPCGITKAGGFVDGSSKGTWIWILDTGIDLDHPDLNVLTSSTYARSFVTGQAVDDGNGHGTHCAGIAAAKNNTIGVVGVSAGARVVPVKVLPNSGSGGSWDWILAGLNHVAMYDIPGDVINMSLGGYGYINCMNSWPALRDAIWSLGNSGTYVVMAAGNDNADANLNRPGCISGNRVYTVGGMSCANACYSNSNWNTTTTVPVDWVAVGVSVYSTYKDGSYGTLTGTSMATPHVAGIIHARNGPPVSIGNISCKGKLYPVASR